MPHHNHICHMQLLTLGGNGSICDVGIELKRFLKKMAYSSISYKKNVNVASSKFAQKARQDFCCNQFHMRPFFGKSYQIAHLLAAPTV